MKTAFATLAAVALVGASAQRATAGDQEWATAGKILTGVVAASVISRAFEPVPVYQTTTTYAPPAVVYASAPPPVIVQPMPTVVYRQPVYVQPAPVYVAPAPACVAPPTVYIRPPIVSLYFGFGHRLHAPFYRVCR